MPLPNLEQQIAFLDAKVEEDQAHSGSSLIQHLIGTRDILASWNASPALCTAGLFHSVYGTQSYDTASISTDDRSHLQEFIGRQSEEIAYLFSVKTRESFELNFVSGTNFRIQHRKFMDWIAISDEMFRDLCNLSAANWLEQLPRLSQEYHEMGTSLSRNLLRFVMPDAKLALDAAYGFSKTNHQEPVRE